MTLPQVSVVNYGVGNLRSIKRGLEKSGAKALMHACSGKTGLIILKNFAKIVKR